MLRSDLPRYPNDVAKNEFFKKLLQGGVIAVIFFVTADQVWALLVIILYSLMSCSDKCEGSWD